MRAEMWETNSCQLYIFVTDDEGLVTYGIASQQPEEMNSTWKKLFGGDDPIKENWGCGDFGGYGQQPPEELIGDIRETREYCVKNQYTDSDTPKLIATIENGEETIERDPEYMGNMALATLGFHRSDDLFSDEMWIRE